MHRICTLLATVGLAVLGFPAFGQSPDVAVLRGQSDQTYKRLVEADRMLVAGKAAEAMESLQRIVDEAGDDLVSADGVHYRTARQVAQRVLVKLPPDALKAYRDRADEPAKALLDAGRKARDPRPLRTLIERYSVSRAAEEALLLLGELAFERGDFRTAESYWRRLLPMVPNAAEPAFPDPKTDPALVRARIALALIFQGELDAARMERKLLETMAPKAVGRLAGVDGPLLDTLQKVLDRPPVFATDQNGNGEWTAFAGSPSRTGSATGRLPYYWPSRPTWQVPIPRDDVQLRISKLPRVAPTKSVGFHPVVVDGIAYLADAVRVFGYDPRTGKKVFTYDLRTDGTGARATQVRVPFPLTYDADFTLSASNGRLFARLGGPEMKPAEPDPLGRAGPSPSVLIGFGPPAKPSPTSPPLEKQWTLLPPATTPSSAAWEGAPIAAEGRLYAAFDRFEGTRVIHAVACYEDPPTNPVWVADLAESPFAVGRFRHELLALAGGNLIYCTHTGLVIAIDARTAKLAWAMKYPRTARTIANPPYRDLSPPLAEGGRVFVAPSDSDHLFALDAETGRTLWKSGPIQVDQMLGATRGRLICTIAGPVRGIRGYSLREGNYSDILGAGWAIHDDPLLASFGRGLVSNDLILWPTNSDLFLLNPETGLPLRPPVRGPHGNLAYADGVLLVATPTELWGYVSDRVELPRRSVEAALSKGDGDAQRRFAIALADAGKWDEAKAAIAGDPDAARFRAEWNSDRAERALAAGRYDEAEKLWFAILKGDDPPSWKARAAFRLYDGKRIPFTAPTKQITEAVASIPVPPEAIQAWVPTSSGRIERWADKLPRSNETEARGSDPVAKPIFSAFEFDPVSIHSLGVGTAAKATPFDSNRFVTLPNFQNRAGLPGYSRGLYPTLAIQCDGSAVRAYSLPADRVLWQTTLPTGFAATQAYCHAAVAVVAGPRGVVWFDLATGKLIGEGRLPESDQIASRTGLSYPRSADTLDRYTPISSFEMDASVVTADLGEHHRIRFFGEPDLSPSIRDTEGYPRYRPFALGTNTKFRESPFGEQAKIAKLLGELKFDIAGEASLTGQPPIVLSLPKSVLVGVRRNFGVELTLLGSTRGSRTWGSRTAVIPVDSFASARVDFDETNVYIPAEGRLYAIRLADGVMVWTAELGAGADWQIAAGRKAIAAYPIQPIVREDLNLVLRRIGRSLWNRPDLSRIPPLLVGLTDSWLNRTLPIRFLDPETGREVHRLDLDVGPVAVVQFGPERSVVVTADRIYRLQSP